MRQGVSKPSICLFIIRLRRAHIDSGQLKAIHAPMGRSTWRGRRNTSCGKLVSWKLGPWSHFAPAIGAHRCRSSCHPLRRETLLRSAGRRTWKIVNVNLRVQRLVPDGRFYPGVSTVERACRQASHKASCGTRRPWLCLTATGGQPAMAISHFPAGRREV